MKAMLSIVLGIILMNSCNKQKEVQLQSNKNPSELESFLYKNESIYLEMFHIDSLPFYGETTYSLSRYNNEKMFFSGFLIDVLPSKKGAVLIIDGLHYDLYTMIDSSHSEFDEILQLDEGDQIATVNLILGIKPIRSLSVSLDYFEQYNDATNESIEMYSVDYSTRKFDLDRIIIGEVLEFKSLSN